MAVYPTEEKKRVAVLGGGLGALTAAFALTSPENPDAHKYEVTVYQLGWRLGGKGASGRNQAIADRIEEHGLHVWMGFYENAFAVMREAYAEWKGPGNLFGDWRNAFTPQSYVPYQEYVEGQWRTWAIDYPMNTGLPGDGSELPSLWDYVEMLLGELWDMLTRHQLVDAAKETSHKPASWLSKLFHHAVEDVEGELAKAGGMLLRHALDFARLLDADPKQHDPKQHSKLDALLGKFLHWLWETIGKDVENDDTLRRLWILVELGVANLRGAIAEGVFTKGLGVLNRYEYRDFLRKYGASELTLSSVPVRAIYDLYFAFEDGDIDRPNIAAGVALHAIMRMVFTYKGAIFWKMNAGMGDTIVSPMYAVLRQRGVKFKFFHRVTDIEDDGSGAISTLRMMQQVRLRKPDTEYDPLIMVDGLACWPSEPLYDQIDEAQAKKLQAQNIDLESFWTPWKDEGEEEALTLNKGEDFDLVVLGMPPAVLRTVMSESIRARADWRAMLDNVGTVQTMAAQLWIEKDLAEMGWNAPSPITTAYAEPLDTWCDMSHLLVRESWKAPYLPKDISYFCGPMQDPPSIPPPGDHAFPGREADRVKDAAMQWFDAELAHFLPSAAPVVNPAGFDYNLLVDTAPGRSGRSRFDSQYWRANCDPSHRYTQSTAGSIEHRLAAGASGFDNLILCGDWIDCIINVGCVESTVMSGLLASRAISGYPETIVGENIRS
ncbi:NAD(P)-binding protein [bacterium]|nr:NAD(P)-binding protein [bacterium]